MIYLFAAIVLLLMVAVLICKIVVGVLDARWAAKLYPPPSASEIAASQRARGLEARKKAVRAALDDTYYCLNPKCGNIVPEGRQLCPECEKAARKP